MDIHMMIANKMRTNGTDYSEVKVTEKIRSNKWG